MVDGVAPSEPSIGGFLGFLVRWGFIPVLVVDDGHGM